MAKELLISNPNWRSYSIILSLGIFFLLTVSLVTNPTIHNGNSGFKEIWFLIAVGILCSLYCYGIVLKGSEYFISVSLLDALIITYFLYSIGNTFAKTEFAPATYHETTVLLGLLLTYLAIKNWMALGFITPNQIIFIFCLVALLQLMLGYFQHFKLALSNHSDFNITGAFSNPGPYAIYLSALTAFSVPIVLLKIKRKENWTSIAYQFLVVMASLPLILLCYSRSSWVGLIASIIFIIIWLKPRMSLSLFRSLRHTLITVLLLITLTLSIGFWLFNLKQESALGRLLTWNISFNISREHFLTGVGKGNFPVRYLEYQYAYFSSQTENSEQYSRLAGDVRYAFCDALQELCEEGLIGLLLFSSIIVLAVRFSVRRYSDPTCSASEKITIVACWAGLLVFLASGLSSYPLRVLPIRAHFWMLLAVIAGSTDHIVSRHQVIRIGVRSMHLVKKAIIGAIFIIVASFFILTGAKRWIGFSTLYVNQNTSSAELLKLYPIVADNPSYLIILGRSYMTEKAYLNAVEVLQQAKKISPDKEIYYHLGDSFEELEKYHLAEQQYQYVSTAIPSLLVPKYMLAKLYYVTNQTTKWAAMADQVVRFKPKVESSNTFLMQQEIQALIALRAKSRTTPAF